MVTVKEVFDYAVEIDAIHLAHRTYWAIRNQSVALDDDIEKLKTIDYNNSEIAELVERNMLGIGRIKLFVIETARKGWYSFILAESSLDAQSLHTNLFRERAGNVTRADRLMVPMMHFTETGKDESLYDYRKRIVEYPAYIGHAKSGEHVLYKIS